MHKSNNQTETQMPPNTERKGKRKCSGRVKRACENCKKAKRQCDPGRPCGRCVRIGIEAGCRDAERRDSKIARRDVVDEITKCGRLEQQLLANPVSPTQCNSPQSPAPAPAENPKTPFPNECFFQQNTDSDLSSDSEPYEIVPDLKSLDYYIDCYINEQQDIASFCFVEDNDINFDCKRQVQMDKYTNLIEEIESFKTSASATLYQFPYTEYDAVVEGLQKLREARKMRGDLLPLNFGYHRNEGLWLLKEGYIMNWNRAAWEDFGYVKNDLWNKVRSPRDFVYANEWKRMIQVVTNAWYEGITEFSDVFCFVTKGGSTRRVLTNFLLIPNKTQDGLPYILCCNSLCHTYSM